MGPWAIVAAGSALGGMARYAMSGWVQNSAGDAFPWGTLLVNLTGCLLLGMLVRWLGDVAGSAQWRLFLAIGFCGAYTTFSTFTFEAVQLVRERDWSAAAGYMGVSLFGGVAALVLGIATAEWFLRVRS